MMRSLYPRYGVPVLAAVLTVSSQLSAQEAPVLRLSEALEIAREHNPAYRKAVAQLEVAAIAERSAWGAMLPTLNLNLSTGMSQSRRFSGQDNFGQPIKREEPLVFTGSSSSQSISFGQVSLFDGGAKLGDLRAARASRRATYAAAAEQEIRLATEVATRYYEAVRAQHLIALEERLLESARERLTATERLLRVAVTDPLDLLGVEVEVAQRELALEQARGDARKARLALGEELGLGQEVGFALPDEFPDAPDPAVLDMESLVDSAAERSPALAKFAAREEEARHRLASARANRLPELALGAYLGRNIGGSGQDAFFDLRPIDQSYGFSLNLSIPVFSGFNTSHSIAQARAQRTSAGEDLRAARLLLEREVRGAVIDLENAQRKVSLAQRSAALSRDRAEMTQERYTLGGIGFRELQDSVERAAEAEREALNARFDAARALVDLEERVGRALR